MLRPWVKLVLVLVLIVVLVLVVSLMGWHIGRVRVLVLRVLVLRMLVSSYPVRLVVRVCWATVGILIRLGVGLIWSLILVLILISIPPSEILVVPPRCISFDSPESNCRWNCSILRHLVAPHPVSCPADHMVVLGLFASSRRRWWSVLLDCSQQFLL